MIVIIDFGSQYNQLIARRVREHHVFCQIESPGIPLSTLKARQPEGIILSGGPSSIYETGSPKVDPGIFTLGVPVLGICYGMQFMTAALGGSVERGERRAASPSFASPRRRGCSKDRRNTTLMSHGDSIRVLPKGFHATAPRRTPASRLPPTPGANRRVQFHPEVAHTPRGGAMLKNFLFDICGCKRSWSMKSFAREAVAGIHENVGDKKVILGLSGGVDSSVAAVLIHRAIGKRLTCIFVDNGLLRKHEAARLKLTLRRHLQINIRFVKAGSRFMTALAGVTEPERKRKIIGRVFMDVFEAEARKIKGAEFLAQGTLYPDVIESVSAFGGPSAVIKSHHNVGGLPRQMKLKLIEPLRYLFKDEVRELGTALGLPDELVWRQPFPGPGLAIRVLGAVNARRLAMLRNVEDLLEEIKGLGYYKKLWQSFAVLLPLKSVGGGRRPHQENIAAIRAVTSRDATPPIGPGCRMTLRPASNRIINEVAGVNRVVYDISRSPSTIEWE
jgi:GMP synthase (glutamine-hydrolysing)